MNSQINSVTNTGGQIPGTRRSGSPDPDVSAPSAAKSIKGPQEGLTASPPEPQMAIAQTIDVDLLELSNNGPSVRSIVYINLSETRKDSKGTKKKKTSAKAETLADVLMRQGFGRV
jgi:hypothetical protein